MDEAIKPDDFTGELWDRHRHVREVPTDAFGDISFGGLGQKTAKVKQSLMYLTALSSGVLNVFILNPCLYLCPISVCTSVHRHQPRGPVPVDDGAVESYSSQPSDLSDRRSQELLPEDSSEEYVPQRSHQSGPDHRWASRQRDAKVYQGLARQVTALLTSERLN